MKLAAARAIADSVPEVDLASTFVVPSVFDKTVPYRVAEAVSAAAVADGVCRS
jgi:malate dehydrogenase (oxaloacetate-decarboxylating)